MALVVPGAGAIPNPLSVIAATGRGGGGGGGRAPSEPALGASLAGEALALRFDFDGAPHVLQTL